MKKSNLKSPYQARQIVVHGHVSLGNRKINLPGYLVRKDEESQKLVHFTPRLKPLSNTINNKLNYFIIDFSKFYNLSTFSIST